jgi:hypothetical protein
VSAGVGAGLGRSASFIRSGAHQPAQRIQEAGRSGGAGRDRARLPNGEGALTRRAAVTSKADVSQFG